MIPSIKLVGDPPVFLSVIQKIGVHQKESSQSNPNLPSLGPDLAPRHVQIHNHRSLSVRRQSLPDGEILKHVVDGRSLLPSVSVDFL